MRKVLHRDMQRPAQDALPKKKNAASINESRWIKVGQNIAVRNLCVQVARWPVCITREWID